MRETAACTSRKPSKAWGPRVLVPNRKRCSFYGHTRLRMSSLGSLTLAYLCTKRTPQPGVRARAACAGCGTVHAGGSSGEGWAAHPLKDAWCAELDSCLRCRALSSHMAETRRSVSSTWSACSAATPCSFASRSPRSGSGGSSSSAARGGEEAPPPRLGGSASAAAIHWSCVSLRVSTQRFSTASRLRSCSFSLAGSTCAAHDSKRFGSGEGDRGGAGGQGYSGGEASTARGTSRVGSPGTRPGDGSHACTVTVLAGAPLPPRCSRPRRGRRRGMLAGALATFQGARRRGYLREPERRCRAAPWPWRWMIRPRARARARAQAQAQRQVLPSVLAQERALAWALVLVRPHARA